MKSIIFVVCSLLSLSLINHWTFRIHFVHVLYFKLFFVYLEKTVKMNKVFTNRLKEKKYFIILLFRVKSGFDSENLKWLEQLFRQTVGDEMEIKRDDFNKILITKNVRYLFIIYYNTDIIWILRLSFINSCYIFFLLNILTKYTDMYGKK